MQTFLPYASFTETAEALDRQRLGKQRVEAWQLLQVLTGEKLGWRNHPAAHMWAGHEYALAEYGAAICREWRERGYKDIMLDRFLSLLSLLPDTGVPSWLGLDDFHASHRSNLLRKDFDWYARFGWSEPDDLPYVWPIP